MKCKNVLNTDIGVAHPKLIGEVTCWIFVLQNLKPVLFVCLRAEHYPKVISAPHLAQAKGLREIAGYYICVTFL